MINSLYKRTELHIHTDMSAMAGVDSVTEIIKTSADRGDIGTLAVTDINSVQAFRDAEYMSSKTGIKVIYGIDISVKNDTGETQVMLLVKNDTGRINLFGLVTEAYSKGADHKPLVSFDTIKEKREGLLMGASCDGEITEAVLTGAGDEDIIKRMDKYDYIEVQPPENMVTDRYDMEDCQNAVKRVIALAEKAGKDVVAVSNAYFIDKDEQICHEALTYSSGTGTADTRPLYMRKTEELLDDLMFLGEKKAYQIVLENTDKISAMCDPIFPLSKKKYSITIPGGGEKLRNICKERASMIYGSPLPDPVRERMDMELKNIIGNGYEAHYLIPGSMVEESNRLGYMVGNRGFVAASFVAYLCGITYINPLKAHYYCTGCHYFEEVSSDGTGKYSLSGYDLPDKECPVCGKTMMKDGLEIPVETLISIKGDREPDIDLNFAKEVRDRVVDHLGEEFGKDNIVNVGDTMSLSYAEARDLLNEYCRATGNFKAIFDEAYIKKIAGTKKNKQGIHPGGIIILPDGIYLNDITPVQYAKTDDNREKKVTHLQSFDIFNNINKYDLLNHPDPSILHDLEAMTGVSLKDIPDQDSTIMSLFQNSSVLGIKDGLQEEPGTLGVSEFSWSRAREMLKYSRVECFDDLIRVSGLIHGTGTWEGNAEIFLKNGKTIAEVIGTRDDIMLYLISKGIEREIAFAIMDRVRKGRGITDENISELKKHGIPNWYIDSCKRIRYLFPKAHAASYVKLSWKMAFYKIHYPKEFYSVIIKYRYHDILSEVLDNDPETENKLMSRYDGKWITPYDEEYLAAERIRDLRELLNEATARGIDIKDVI